MMPILRRPRVELDGCKTILPFYIRYRQYRMKTPEKAGELPVQIDGCPPIYAEGTLAPEQITAKIKPGYFDEHAADDAVESKPVRRISTHDKFPASHYEFVCRLRPKLELRAVAYILILLTTCLFWFDLCFMKGQLSPKEILPLVTAALGAAAYLDKESSLRKRMFRWIQRCAAFAMVAGFLQPWMKAMVYPSERNSEARMSLFNIVYEFIKNPYSLTYEVKTGLFCMGILVALIITTLFCLFWLFRHSLNSRMSYVEPRYHDKVRIELHERTDEIEYAKMLSFIEKANALLRLP